MIQAIGLTSAPRGGLPPAVDDLTFEARPGNVTVLHGPAAAGKTTALRLMLQLETGRGVALFRGRPLHRVPNPAREIGVLLGDVPGRPSRTARGHLRMLTAAAGVPADRADDVLDLVGLSGLADKQIGDLSRGMDRRLGMAAALLGDPHTLVLDEPTEGLAPRETAWLHGLLRGYAAQGGAVLITSRNSREAARIADHVVTLHDGRLAADQEAVAFARTRMRPRVAVRSPHADRLADVLIDESQRAQRASDPAIGRSVEVVRESGSRIAVYGSSCAAVGETAFRHRILVHQLTDEAGDTTLASPLHRADGRPAPAVTEASEAVAVTSSGEAGTHVDTHIDMTTSVVGDIALHATSHTPGNTAAVVDRNALSDTLTLPVIEPSTSVPRQAPPASSPLAERLAIPRLPAPGPAWPLRYELRRTLSDGSGLLVAVVTLLVSLVLALLLARHGAAPTSRVMTGWPRQLPFPPAALGAGLLGSLAFGQEFRYPALAHERGAVPRRLGLLVAKLLVSGAAALALGAAVLAADEVASRTLFGPNAANTLSDWPVFSLGWAGLLVGCAWAGVLAAGVFRSTAMGLAAVLAVPVAVMPLVQHVLAEPAARSLAGLPGRLRSSALVQWPSGIDQGVSVVLRLATQPVGGALTLSLAALVCAYALTVLRHRAH
ncbi:ATP-binding cassette domain-containing protein [Streptomyces pinistramenti]|uniref:ATP-binding cassette domain-containing protein n=1 Tax=Streptomyces pinistramenti TaxID=2884812 RepID=UPI001D06B3FA|nr:ATP-binding cassette domain-containing protein [Streptomyces pinistramenti]MCB5906433.1 ATP-binding cassette domain-containing protein [Streptomyces pinistramenti]